MRSPVPPVRKICRPHRHVQCVQLDVQLRWLRCWSVSRRHWSNVVQAMFDRLARAALVRFSANWWQTGGVIDFGAIAPARGPTHPIAGYVSAVNASSCAITCPLGTGLTTVNSQACLPCPAGTFNSGNSRYCSGSCPAGNIPPLLVTPFPHILMVVAAVILPKCWRFRPSSSC